MIVAVVLGAFNLCIALMLLAGFLARQKSQSLRAVFFEVDPWGVHWFDSARHDVGWRDR